MSDYSGEDDPRYLLEVPPGVVLRPLILTGPVEFPDGAVIEGAVVFEDLTICATSN